MNPKTKSVQDCKRNADKYWRRLCITASIMLFDAAAIGFGVGWYTFAVCVFAVLLLLGDALRLDYKGYCLWRERAELLQTLNDLEAYAKRLATLT